MTAAQRGQYRLLVVEPDLHEGTEAPGLGVDVEAGLRVLAEDATLPRLREELEGPVEGELVGRDVVGDRG